MAVSSERFVITSLGSIGLRHLQNLRLLRPDSQIAVLRRPEAQHIDLPAGCDFLFTDFQDLIEYRPTAAVVAGPASTHIEIATKLVERGIPVLVEKPISNNLDGVKTLIEKADASNIVLMTGYNLRFLSSLSSVRNKLLSGEIGNILAVRAEVGQYLPSWRPALQYSESVSARKSLGGGALLELSHEIDYIYWLFGMPHSVYCDGGTYSDLKIDVEDVAEIVLEYREPSCLISIHLDFLQHHASRCCKFIGSEGTLIWDGIDDQITVHALGNDGIETTTLNFEQDRNSMYLDELAHFLECVEKNSVPMSSGKEGMDVLTIAMAAKQSMATRRAVDIGAFLNG